MQYPVRVEYQKERSERGHREAARIPAHQAEQQQHGTQAGHGERKPRSKRVLAQRFEAHRRNCKQPPGVPRPGGIRPELAFANVMIYGRLGVTRPVAGVFIKHVDSDQVHAVVGERPAELEQTGGEHRGGSFVLPKIRAGETPEQENRRYAGDGSLRGTFQPVTAHKPGHLTETVTLSPSR